jgi:DNA polymerase IV (DinB-like DNA polymerase)
MQSRVVMLVDLDYFFAQAEELRDPSIRDKPIVVCVYTGRSQDSGVVSTANYIARKFGVKSGMPIFLAKKKLEKVDAVFLPVDHEYYGQVSDKVMQILRTYADSFEQMGIDEAYLEVTQRVADKFEKAEELAQTIKNEIKKELQLTCSIGVGPNKLIAKVVADIKKPDGLTLVKPDEVQGFLFPLPVSRILGIGRKTEERMAVMGIRTVGDLAKHDVQRLIQVFGRSLGSYFNQAAQGIDESPVEEVGEAESISRIVTLKENTHDLTTILMYVDPLSEDLHASARDRGLAFKSVGISAVMADMSAHSRSKTLDNATDDLETLKQTVKELFEKFLGETDLEARRVGVKISSFVEGASKQQQITRFIQSK